MKFIKLLLYSLFVIAVSSLIIYSYLYCEHEIASVVCQLICKICGIYVVFLLGNKLRKKPLNIGATTQEFFNNSYIVPSLLIVSVIVYTFANPIFIQTMNIHTLYSEPNYSIRGYYVKAKQFRGKEYTLKAKISVSVVEFEDNSYNPATFNYETTEKTKRAFYVSKLYFDNGGYLFFAEPEAITKANETISQKDQNEQWWDITLLNEYIKENNIDVNVDFSIMQYISLLSIPLTLIEIIILFSYLNKYTKTS